jgi:methionine-rich copper-binding protein CopC
MVIRSALLAVCALFLSAAPAAAHAELIGSNPAAGAAVPAAPTQVELTFNGPVTPQAVSVTGPGGVTWAVQTPSVAGVAVVQAPVVPAGPAGEYTIAYEVLSEDGDAVRGTVVFTLTAAVPAPTTTTLPPTTTSTTVPPTSATTPSESASPAEDSDDGMPVSLLLIGGAVVLVAAATVVLVRVKRR